MSSRFRGFFARRLSAVGPQLQVFWQKTLTSGQSLKKALSPPVSPRSKSFPITKPGDGPSQETFLPVFNANEEASAPNVHIFSNSRPHSTITCATSPLYANAATQTEQSPLDTTPGSELEDIHSHNGCDTDSCHDEAPFVVEDFEAETYEESSTPLTSEPGNGNATPVIPEGSSRVLLMKYDEEDCLAILITKEMVEYANEIKSDSSKLERAKDKLIDAQRNVELTRAELTYCEGLIQSSESPAVIDDLRRDIAQRQSTLPQEEERRDDLEQDVILLKRNLAYSESLLKSMTLRLLDNANLLETPAETPEEEEDRSQNEDHVASSEVSCSSNVSIDQLYRRAVDAEVEERSQELREAEERFEMRHEEYEQENKRFHRKLLEGTVAMSQTGFDLCFFENTQELTRELGAAQDAHEEVLTRMKKLGPNQWDQESGFITDEYDEVDDGYAMSSEVDGIGIGIATQDLIHSWLEHLLEAESFLDVMYMEQGEDDESKEDDQEGLKYCDIRSATMSDAVSCCDMSRNRRRIDKWRAITGRER